MYEPPNLTGTVAMVTGANSGLGKATARSLAGAGARVFLACRSKERAQPVVEAIRTETEPDRAEFLELDLASFGAVRSCAETFLRRDLPLHILVNNAAVVGRGTTEEGFELNFGVNHLGHFLLTGLLLDRIMDSAPARIVTVPGYKVRHLHAGTIDFEAVRTPTSSYSGLPEYVQSKVANALFGFELADRLVETEIDSYLAVPGAVATNIFDGFVPPFSWIAKLGKRFMQSPEEGAETLLYCATAPEIKDNPPVYYLDREPAEPDPVVYDTELRGELWERSADWTDLPESIPRSKSTSAQQVRSGGAA